jgi:hypothetical protein
LDKHHAPYALKSEHFDRRRCGKKTIATSAIDK